MDCWLPVTIRPLTERQRQVVQLLAEGLTRAQIARQLGISDPAVRLAELSASRRLRLMSEAERIAQIWPERAHENALSANA